MSTKVYLACPYTHENDDVRHLRFLTANHVAGCLMKRGLIVFSPISHTHTICNQLSLPSDHKFWKHYDDPFIDWADEVYIVTAPGWTRSTGVAYERSRAIEQGKPVRYVDPITIEVTSEGGDA